MSKTGADYLKRIKDDRQIYLDGKLVENPTDHPAFKPIYEASSRLYDYQAANEELMTITSPTNGKRVARHWDIPLDTEALIMRGKAHIAMAEQSCGFFGRSPDAVGGCFAGMVANVDFFRDDNDARANAALGYFEHIRDNDLFLTFTIVNPQGDRSKAVGDQGSKYHTCCVVDEDTSGITVSGAKMLGTSAVVADEIFTGVQNPLSADDKDYALSFAMPMGANGIKILSRRSYATAASSEFDYPLSTHFDENDSIIYFDEVKVPWDRVFVFRRPDLVQAQFHRTYGEAFLTLQGQARLLVKMRFMAGLARRITETIGTINFPPVQQSLGWLSMKVTMVDAVFRSLLHDPVKWNGYSLPRKDTLYGVMAYTQDLYGSFLQEIRELAGGGLIMLPSSVEDFGSAEVKPIIEQTQRSSHVDSETRVKIMKLAWDALGSEFASRHALYELFYAGPPFVARDRCFRSFDWESGTRLVDEFMDSYKLEASLTTGLDR